MNARAVWWRQLEAAKWRLSRTRLTLGLLAAAVFVLAAFPRLTTLDRALTADEYDNWMERSARFYGALVARRFEETYQSYHPGVTITWLGGLSLAAADVIHPSDPARPWRWAVDTSRMALALPAARFPIALLASLSLVVLFLLLHRLVGTPAALAGALVVAFDPFDLAHSRLIHLDASVSHFMLLSLLAALVYWHGAGSYRFWLLSGLLAGLAVLTKAPSAYLFLFVPLAGLVWRLAGSPRREWPRHGRRWLLDLLVWGAVALVVFASLWPAFWHNPLGLIREMLVQQQQTAAVPHGRLNYFLGEVVRDPGPLFYVIAYLLRAAPLTLAGLVLIPLLALRRRWLPAGWWPILIVLLAYGVLFGALITPAAKKFDRYLLPAFPAFDLAATLALLGLLAAASRAWRWGRGLAFALALAFAAQSSSALALHPYYLAWYNPLSGGPAVWSRALLVGWGEGLDLAADYLNSLPDASQLRVVALYRGFWPFFQGHTIPPERYDRAVIDYVVTYSSQHQRGHWRQIEADLAGLAPEHVVTLNGLPYAEVYALPRVTVPSREDIRFGEVLALDEFAISPGMVRPGEKLAVTLYWRALQPPPVDYKVFVHLLDANGQRHGSRDRPLGPEAYPVSIWRPGDQIAWSHTASVAADTPPGPLWVVVGVYDPETGTRLPPTAEAAFGPELTYHGLTLRQIMVIDPAEGALDEES